MELKSMINDQILTGQSDPLYHAYEKQ